MRTLFASLLLAGAAIVVQAQTEQSYLVTFSTTWSAQTHPQDFPPSPHFSRLVGATHEAAVSLWTPGETASDGIERMAEVGATSTLEAEMDALVMGGAALSPVVGDGIPLSPGSTTVSVTLADDRPLITLVSMLAPSPDWFVGVRGLDLRDGGGWADEVSVELFVYDAGTDSGESYTSANADTQPHGVIARIETSPFKVGDDLRSVGTMTFTRQTPAAETPAPLNAEVGPVFPNPATGAAWLDVTTVQAQVAEIELFDVLGRRVSADTRSLSAGTHRLAVPIDGVAPGFYLVRTAFGDGSTTRRLVVR